MYYQPLVWLSWRDAPPKSGTFARQIGQYMAVARRSAATWYRRAMTNETSRTLHIPLTFLGSGNWTAKIYADEIPASSPSVTSVVVSPATVSSSTTLTVPAGAGRWPGRL